MTPSEQTPEFALQKKEELSELNWIADGLEPDARMVLMYLARRLHRGQKQYGKMDLAKEARNLLSETLEEHIDAINYLAMEILRQQRIAQVRTM